jgi:hypothetical protein
MDDDDFLLEGIDEDLFQKLEKSALANGRTIEDEIIFRLELSIQIEDAQRRLRLANQAAKLET